MWHFPFRLTVTVTESAGLIVPHAVPCPLFNNEESFSQKQSRLQWLACLDWVPVCKSNTSAIIKVKQQLFQRVHFHMFETFCQTDRGAPLSETLHIWAHHSQLTGCSALSRFHLQPTEAHSFIPLVQLSKHHGTASLYKPQAPSWIYPLLLFSFLQLFTTK